MSPHHVEALYDLHCTFVTHRARKLAQGDRDLTDDIAQEAWLALVQLPDSTPLEPRYIRTVLARAMQHYLDRERAQQVVTPEHRPPRAVRARASALHLRHHTPRVTITAEQQEHQPLHREAA